MSRVDFMKELESLLSDIPLEERQEALQYYNDYFEDAGEDHEDEIIKELGSPERVAGMIKADLNANATDRESRGFYTEMGYKDTLYTEDKFEIIEPSAQDSKKDNDNAKREEKNGYDKERYTRNTKIGWGIIIGFFMITVGFPVLMSLFGVLLSVILTIIGLFLGFGFAGLAMIGAGVALFILGIIQMGIPFAGLILCGVGLLVFGLGMLFVLFSVILCKKVIPAIFKGIIELCRRPFRNRSVMA